MKNSIHNTQNARIELNGSVPIQHYTGRVKLLTFELGKREMMAMPLLATAAAEEEDVEGKGGREAASGRSPSPFSVF